MPSGRRPARRAVAIIASCGSVTGTHSLVAVPPSSWNGLTRGRTLQPSLILVRVISALQAPVLRQQAGLSVSRILAVMRILLGRYAAGSINRARSVAMTAGVTAASSRR